MRYSAPAPAWAGGDISGQSCRPWYGRSQNSRGTRVDYVPATAKRHLKDSSALTWSYFSTKKGGEHARGEVPAILDSDNHPEQATPRSED